MCFVIMPIGSEGSAEHSHFRSVFDVIIKPAAEEAGYRVWRGDDSAFSGSITKEIVEALASADLVIADLTDRNPNVYLELGIRHCLRRSGTIHLIRDDQALPFDVAGYRAIKYSTEFDRIDAVRTAIGDAIRHKESAPEVSDNPVHDTLELPQDYRATAESEQVRQLESTQRHLAEVTRELEALRRRYQRDGGQTAIEDIHPAFFNERELAAKLTSISTQISEDSLPNQLIVRAQQAAASGELTELVTIAQKLLLDPFTNVSNYRVLAQVAGRAGLDQLKLLVAEQAAAKFPGDADTLVSFAETCIHTPDPATQERGKRLLESYLGIEWGESGPRFTKDVMPNGDIQVGILLDFYHSNERSVEELALALAALEQYGETAVILRNVGRAYEDMAEETSAEEYYSRAVTADSMDDTTLAWFGAFYARRREWEAARALHLKACEADPDDARLVVALLMLCMAEAQATGSLRNPTSVERFKNLAALAIYRGHGARDVRASCAQRMHVSGNPDIAALCLDPTWPTSADVESGEASLAHLGQDAA